MYVMYIMDDLLGFVLSVIFLVIFASPAFLSFGIASFVGEFVKRKNKLKVQLLVLFICLILLYPLILSSAIPSASGKLTLEKLFYVALVWITNPYCIMIIVMAWAVGAIIFYLKRPRQTSAPSEDKSE